MQTLALPSPFFEQTPALISPDWSVKSLQTAMALWNKHSRTLASATIARIANLLSSFRERKQYKYLMFNLPDYALEDVKKFLPCCDSPTVTPLATEGMIAVHSLIETKDIWRLVVKIKDCGGSAILVSAIETFIR